ncbi:hypothetical protein LINPERHAP2_LOCUS25470 [Linum perenne]
MSRKLPQLWSKKGGVQVSDVGFGFYVVNFETVADYERAMFGGPWMVNDHYVVIQELRPYFHPEETFLSTLRVWVRLPGLPFEYFDHAILKHISDRIGKTVRIDNTTLEGSRCNFARICVEVNLAKPLLSKYMLRRRVRRIEYEGLHTICFNCGCYGHKEEACKQEPETMVSEIQPTVFANPIFQGAMDHDIRPEVEEDFGPWMQVKKNRRKPSPAAMASAGPTKVSAPATNSPPAKDPLPAKDNGKGNRFSIFGNKDNQDDFEELDSREQDTVKANQDDLIAGDAIKENILVLMDVDVNRLVGSTLAAGLPASELDCEPISILSPEAALDRAREVNIKHVKPKSLVMKGSTKSGVKKVRSSFLSGRQTPAGVSGSSGCERGLRALALRTLCSMMIRFR